MPEIKKKTIQEKKYELELIQFDMDIEELKEFLEACEDHACEKFVFESRVYDDEVEYAKIIAIHEREENDEEFQARKSRTEKHEELIRQRDLIRLKELKAKYEND